MQTCFLCAVALGKARSALNKAILTVLPELFSINRFRSYLQLRFAK